MTHNPVADIIARAIEDYDGDEEDRRFVHAIIAALEEAGIIQQPPEPASAAAPRP